jgi:flagellar biosynthesis protein FlhA
MLRQRVGFAICNQLRGRHRELSVMSLDPRLENELTGNLAGAGRPLDPRLADSLVRRIAPIADRMFHDGRAPVLLCGAEIRKAIKTLTQRAIPRLSVVSVNEIPERIELSSYDVVRTDG